MARCSGNYATIIGHNADEGKTKIRLPSGAKKTVSSSCRAMVGLVAGGGRIDKPILKAGVSYHKYKAKKSVWPKVRGVAMNPVDHPHGGGKIKFISCLFHQETTNILVTPPLSNEELPPDKKSVSLLPEEPEEFVEAERSISTKISFPVFKLSILHHVKRISSVVYIWNSLSVPKGSCPENKSSQSNLCFIESQINKQSISRVFTNLAEARAKTSKEKST